MASFFPKDVEGKPHVVRGLPDSPAAEMEHAQGRQQCDNGGQGDDNPPPAAPALPVPAAAVEPFIGSRRYVEQVAAGLADDVLIFYIDAPEKTTLNVNPDLVQDVYSAELVRRLETSGVKFAA